MNDRSTTASSSAGSTSGWPARLMPALALLAALGPAVARAEDSAATTLEEAVVTAPRYVPTASTTASKMDVPLIETPQSVSVISRDQVDLLNMQNLGQAVRYTAGIVGENFGSDERYDWLTLRGFYPVQYIDGLQAPVGSVTNVGLDLYGFESIEILKGPASVLYGLAPPGGIVNLTSRRPENTQGGEVALQVGEYADKQLVGDFAGPVGDAVDYRFTGLYRHRNTQTDGVTSERTYLAPAATWKIDPATRVTFLGYYQNDQVDGDGGGFLPAQGTLLPNPNGHIPTNRNAGEPNYNAYHREQYGFGYDARHDFSDRLSLQQNLKYSSSSSTMLDVYGAGLQADLRTLTRYNFPFNEDVRSFAVDTRLTGKVSGGGIDQTLLLGVDWRRYTNFSKFGFAFGPSIDIFNPVYGATAITTPALFPYTQQVQKQTGVYLQDMGKIGHVVLTLGGRYDAVRATNGATGRDDNEFSYRAGVNYVCDSGFAPYVAYAKSFQPTYGATFAGMPFIPTYGKQIEGGIKFEPHTLAAGNHLYTTLAVYQLKQNNVLTPDPVPAHLFFNVQTGEVEVKGVELEGVARFQERLSVNWSYSYTKSEVTRSNGADLGKRLFMVPENKVSLLVDYTIQHGAIRGFGLSGGVRYISDYFGDSANQWRTPGNTLIDAVLHYDVNRWHVALNAANLFDKEYLSRCSSNDQCFYGLRRNVTLTVGRKL